MAADEPHHGDLDGRGAPSTLRLNEFCRYFLETCIDQVNFMEPLLQPSELLRRMKLYVDDEISANRLSKGSLQLLREALLSGELARGKAADLTGYQVRPKDRRPWSANYGGFRGLWQIRLEAKAAKAS
jgi:hypothetical protein